MKQAVAYCKLLISLILTLFILCYFESEQTQIIIMNSEYKSSSSSLGCGARNYNILKEQRSEASEENESECTSFAVSLAVSVCRICSLTFVALVSFRRVSKEMQLVLSYSIDEWLGH